MTTTRPPVLIREADVVIDNYKLGQLEKWGFDDAWFAANAPRAVRCKLELTRIQ